jgi:polyisoprenyl-phosphate glycosyltransferase
LSKFELSLVVPVFNEEGSLIEFAKHVRAACEGFKTEFIFIDDGSTDSSNEVIRSLDLPNIRCLNLLTNSGHMAALDAGFRAANGDFIISMDADLQHPPHLIPEMISVAKNQRVDVVYAVRSSRMEDGVFKRISSRVFYGILRKISGLTVRESAADFRLLTKRALEIVNSYPAGFSVFRVLVPSLGLSESQVEYLANERFAGKTKYSLGKMVSLALTSIITSSTRPLNFALASASASAILAVFGFLYVIYEWFAKNTIAGWASLLSVILFMFSVLFLNIGIFSLYLGRLVKQTSGAPFYIIRDSWEKN